MSRCFLVAHQLHRPSYRCITVNGFCSSQSFSEFREQKYWRYVGKVWRHQRTDAVKHWLNSSALRSRSVWQRELIDVHMNVNINRQRHQRWHQPALQWHALDLSPSLMCLALLLICRMPNDSLCVRCVREALPSPSRLSSCHHVT